jgi:hypothetical protein
MVRKTILALLVSLLLILSGVDLLQDFDLPILAEIDSPIQNNNTLESGISASPPYEKFFELPAVQSWVEATRYFGKVLRIHQRDCVFLI